MSRTIDRMAHEGDILLVCGGRDYENRERLDQILRAYHDKFRIACLVHGNAGKWDPKEKRIKCGADKLAGEWALKQGIPVAAFAAPWICPWLKEKAGPERNGWMLRIMKPDRVLAFPGGKGTRNMCDQARAAGVDVIEIDIGYKGEG